MILVHETLKRFSRDIGSQEDVKDATIPIIHNTTTPRGSTPTLRDSVPRARMPHTRSTTVIV
jgi:hypothetical protein